MTKNKDLVFNFFYVGDGDCTLIQFPGGRTYGIIDSNKPAWRRPSVAASTMQKIQRHVCKDSKGADRDIDLAFICVSHPHRDHISGLLELLQVKGVNLKEFWHPLPDVEKLLLRHASPEEDENYSKWTEISKFYYEEQISEFVEAGQLAIQRVGREGIRQLQEMQSVPDIEGVEIYVLNPTTKALASYQEAMDYSYGRLEHLNRNILDRISVVLLFVYGENALLYASDIQQEQWKEIVNNLEKRKRWKHILPVGIMKASHHGGPLSFYEGLWADILGTKGGRIVVSGGSLVHPSDTLIKSIRHANKKPYCTGAGKKCGRQRRKRSLKMTFPTRRWFENNGIRISEDCDPCRGDIRVVLPTTGKPRIATNRTPDEEKCVVGSDSNIDLKDQCMERLLPDNFEVEPIL
ncbi:MAG: hypothetical protein GY845_16130 [Planctomycetes bacterium]|nr:hypothetical protein [Planctomycetota bacterium]